jgi:hypothetical protein
MVIINYAVGSANIAKAGALIRSSDTIEELARITSLLQIRKRNLDSLTLQIEMIPDEMGEFLISETRTRQLLGNYFHSVPSMQFPFSLIKDELEGNRYPLSREARFFSVLGWEAINFDSDDMLGTYVMGYPEFLQPYLENPQALIPDEPELADQPEGQDGLKGRIANMWSKVRSKKERPEPVDPPEDTDQAELPAEEQQNLWQRFTGRFKSRPENPENLLVEAAPETDTGQVMRLLFAFTPESMPPIGSVPQPPGALVPICFLNIVRAYRPDVRSALQAIRKARISFKIMSSGELQDVEGLAKELDLENKDALVSQIITGEELETKLLTGDIASIRQNTVYYQHSSEQMIQVIDILNQEGQFVALQSSSNAEIPLCRTPMSTSRPRAAAIRLYQNQMWY